MNFFNTSGKFKDQSNYLVAFLASVIGLGAFQEGLRRVHINIFSREPTLLNIAVFIVILLFGSTYCSALVLLVDNISITKFPVKGWVSFLASLLGMLALTAPLIFLLLWAISTLIQFTTHSQSHPLAPVALALSGLVGVITSYLAARNSRRREVESLAFRIVVQGRSQLQEEHKSKSAAKLRPNEFDFLQKYEEVANLIKDYLDVMGYSVKNTSLVHMAKALVSKEVLNKEDLADIRSLADIRNTYAHGGKDRMRTRISTSIKQLEAIHQKITRALWDLIAEQEDSVI